MRLAKSNCEAVRGVAEQDLGREQHSFHRRSRCYASPYGFDYGGNSLRSIPPPLRMTRKGALPGRQQKNTCGNYLPQVPLRYFCHLNYSLQLRHTKRCICGHKREIRHISKEVCRIFIKLSFRVQLYFQAFFAFFILHQLSLLRK